VLKEFERLAERGGVLGAMETGYQRGRIQDESLHYEHMKHDGSYPIVGVNIFLNPEPPAEAAPALQRSSEDEKKSQLARLRAFQARNAETAPAALERLRHAAIANENLFAVLMDAARCCSLGQITTALYEVGGQYRRNMYAPEATRLRNGAHVRCYIRGGFGKLGNHCWLLRTWMAEQRGFE